MIRARQLLIDLVIAAGVYGLALGFYLMVFHQPRSATMAASEARLERLARTVEKARAASRDMERLETESHEVEETLTSLGSVLPEELDESLESSSLVALASGLGLEPLEVSVGDPSPRDFHVETEITLWLDEPSAGHLTELMNAIENELPLRRVTGLWVHLHQGQPLEARFTVSLYSMPAEEPHD